MTVEVIRKLPEQTPRVDTGVVQFGEDAPGLFVRGEHAFHIATLVHKVISGTAISIADKIKLNLLVESLQKVIPK